MIFNLINLVNLFNLYPLSVESSLLLSYDNECSDINIYNSNNNIVAFNNEHKLWSIKLNEPIIYNSLSYIKIGDDYDNDVPLCKYCDTIDFNIKYQRDCLIKLVSKNYIYYLNTENGNIVNKFHIIDNVNKNNSLVECYNFLINKWCIRDIIYNGSIYVSIINNELSQYDKCMNGPNVGAKCINNNVSIKLKKAF